MLLLCLCSLRRIYLHEMFHFILKLMGKILWHWGTLSVYINLVEVICSLVLIYQSIRFEDFCDQWWVGRMLSYLQWLLYTLASREPFLSGLFFRDVLVDLAARRVYSLAYLKIICSQELTRLNFSIYRSDRSTGTPSLLRSTAVISPTTKRWLLSLLQIYIGLWLGHWWEHLVSLGDQWLLLSLRTIYGIEYRMIGLLDILTSHLGSLTPHNFYFFQFDAVRRALIFHVKWVVRRTTITLLPNFVLLAHLLISLIFGWILVLHELPSFDISLHLRQSSSLNERLLLKLLLLTHGTIMLSIIFRKPVHRCSEMRWLGIRIVQLCIINELMISSNVFTCAQLVDKVLILDPGRIVIHTRIIGP